MIYLRVVGEKGRRTLIVNSTQIELELLDGANVLLEPGVEEDLREWLERTSFDAACKQLGVGTSVVLALRRHFGIGQ